MSHVIYRHFYGNCNKFSTFDIKSTKSSNNMVDVEVEFNYEAEQSDELSIKAGDIIRNVVMSEGGWWEGELNGKKGMFPDNFVKVIKNPEKDTKKDEGKKKDVQATKRQSVKDLANKLKGQVLEGPPMIRKKETSAKKKRAKVVYSYEPENPDELKLEVGDAVEVIKQEEEGWWEGIVNGKQGMFPSNFVEIVEDSDSTDSADNKIENTEEHMIKGKKVQGIGLGNIFGDGPIKLRSTGGAKKPGDRPSDPPKAEKREEPVRKARESKATTQLSGEDTCLMENLPPIPGGDQKSGENNVDKHPSFKNDVDYIDTDLCFMSAVDDNVDDDSAQLNLDITPDFECIDSSCVINRDEYPAAEEKSSSSDESCADIDCNNNSGVLDANRPYVAVESPEDQEELLAPAPSLSSHTEGDYTERIINILDDLEECLDWSSTNSMSMMEEDSGDNSVSASLVANETSKSTTEPAEADKSLEKELKVLKCWNKTSVTPPQRLSFCKAIDSVLVTKKRLIDSAEKSPCQTPLHPASFQHQSAENASRALNFASGDLGATGFVKFIPETDSHGHTVLVAKPIEVHPHANKVSSHSYAKDTVKALPPYKSPVHDSPKYHTMSNSPQTYFASLNKSGNLSPFIRSIACKYHLFESQKQHGKKFEAKRVTEIADPDESYTMSLLSHQADVQLPSNRVDEDDEDLSDPYVNQMVNNYVYDVISGQHCQQLAKAAAASLSDTVVTSVDSCKADDISMAVCVDDNSVKCVSSGQDLDDDTTGLDEASILTLMSDRNDYSLDQDDMFQLQSTPLNTRVAKSIPDKSQLNKYPNTWIIPEKTPDKAFPIQWSQSSHTHKLPDSGNIRQTSSYCRIPFSDSKAPPFWFSKDFAQSPKSKLELKSRVKSPKRRSSEISEKVPTLFDIAEKVHLEDFREKIEAFKENNQDLSFESSPYCLDNRSPAKKRRKRTSHQVIADYHERHADSGNSTPDNNERQADSTDNINWNALIQLPSEEMPGHVECFFTNDEDSSDKVKLIEDSTSPPLTNEWEGNGSMVSENKTKDMSETDGSMQKSCSASNERLPCRTSVSFSAGYPEFSDITKRRMNRFFFGKRPSPNGEEEIPLKLVSYRKLDEEIIPKKQKQNRTIKSNPKNDIFSNFEHYTQNSLKVCSNKYNENDLFPCKSDVELFKEMNTDMLFENEKSSAVSVYFGTDAEFDCTFVEDPVKVSKQFLTQSCLGIRPSIKSKDMHEKHTNEHQASSDTLNKKISLTALIESRSNMYSAISEAVQSCTDIAYGEDEDDDVEGSTNGLGFSERTEANEKSIRDEVYDVTPDAEAMITDLQSLNLSETPKYADNATDDAELKAFLQDAIGSLDDILTESFTSSTESPLKVSLENRNPDMQEKKTEFDDTFELQDDSVLKVIGRKCVLHEIDSNELQDDAIVKVFGRKSVLHEYKSGDARSQDGVLVDEDEGDYSVEFQNDPVLTVTGKKCVMHEIAIPVQKQDIKDYEIKSDSSKFNYHSQRKNNSLMENCTVRDISPLSVSYDEVYDADGNMIEDNRQSAVHEAYERQPTYICTSPLIPYYETESTLETEGEDEEDRPLCESSPIVFPTGIDSRRTPDWESVVCTPDTAELMEVNFDLQASSVFEETEEELNRTRGSSLDEDLDAVIQDIDQNVTENGAEGFDYTDGVVSEENNESTSEELNIEDIQLRMQDSGEWLEEFTRNRSGAAGDSFGLEGSILSDPVPPEFKEKRSFFPSPKVPGVDDD